LGLVISKYRAQSDTHKTQSHLLRINAKRDGYRRVFDTVIPENSRTAAVMDFSAHFNSLNEKYNYSNPYRVFKSLTEEVLSCV